MAETGLGSLYEVQKIDSEITGRRRAMAELDDGSTAATRVEELRTELAQAEASLHGLEKELLDGELEMKTIESKKKAVEEKLYGGRVRNPKELGDMEHEVQMLRHQIDELTDRVLPMMDEIEERRSGVSQAQQRLAQAEAEFAALRGEFEATSARLREEIAHLEGERSQAAANVEADLLRRYDDIRRYRGDPALVAVDGNICPACHITIPSDTIRAMERGQRMQTCESCGRLFYWTKPSSAAEEGSDGESDQS
jgi:predicted  nucleic acid-binding Zn-ribbon protein